MMEIVKETMNADSIGICDSIPYKAPARNVQNPEYLSLLFFDCYPPAMVSYFVCGYCPILSKPLDPVLMSFSIFVSA